MSKEPKRRFYFTNVTFKVEEKKPGQRKPDVRSVTVRYKTTNAKNASEGHALAAKVFGGFTTALLPPGKKHHD